MRKIQQNTTHHLRRGDIESLLGELGWQTDLVPIEGTAWRAWGWFGEAPRGELVAQQSGCRVVSIRGSVNRRLVLSVARQAPLDTVLWFFVEPHLVTFIVAVPHADGFRVRTLGLDRDVPAPMALERLLRLERAQFARPEVDVAEATRQHVREVLDQESMTRAFFKRFSQALRDMAASVQSGPTQPDERWQSALVVLLRLIFLYFLQRERLLDGDPRYVARRLRRSEGEFYLKTLRPLFFGVLNTPTTQRDALAAALGDVPFLNGGLFEPTPTETRYPDLSWSDEVLATVIEEVFEHFHFTTLEPVAGDEACSVDPEMLGKVFEGLMFGDDRRDSGTFYTPRDVVRGMVETAIDEYVTDREEEGVAPGSALETLRILDPAVGTGAFLLEALRSLRRRRREAGLTDGYADVRRLVHDHLYGVDRNRTAVRLCELRIWLVMLTLMREQQGPIEPLPNLSHRIVAGDSLLDDVSLLRRQSTLSPAFVAQVIQAERHLEATQRAYLEAHGGAKTRARRALLAAEHQLAGALTDNARAKLQAQLEPLEAAVRSKDLFGEDASSDAQRAAVERFRNELSDLNESQRRATTELGGAPGFSYAIRFGAAAREGFDIIVTNPPWVRAQRVDRATRAALASRYASASGQLWPGATEIGIRTPYGAQPDLAALFVERSMELLKPGGRLAALVPAKLFRALHAAPMRRLLAQHCVERIEDLSDADRALFDATVYPGILHVRKDRAANDRVDVSIWRGGEVAHTTCSGLCEVPGAPWLLAPADVSDVLERIRHRSMPLGLRPDGEPLRGIFTGANALFVRPTGEFEREFGHLARPFVRPLLRGSGLGETPTTEILWCYDGSEPVERLPVAIEEYFESHRATLEGRSDYRPELPIWQVFRARSDETRPRVAWRDMSVLLDPVVVNAGPVAANTVYYMPFDDLEDAFGFARWMSSLPVRAVAYGIAERARGGWRRHFAWVVRLLPVPRHLERWRDFNADRQFELTSDDRRVLTQWLSPAAASRGAA